MMRRNALRTAYRLVKSVGVDPRATFQALANVTDYVRDLERYRRMSGQSPEAIPIRSIYPCLLDRSETSGTASGHYFHQDLLVARRVFETRPERHIDVGSRIDGFVAHVASFRDIEVLDVRPQPVRIPNITFCEVDVTRLPHEYIGATSSASCLHALEHFGLGRYGDAVDPMGHERGLEGLHSLVRPGGTLHLSVPVGRERVEFNAQRVFAPQTLLGLFRGRFDIRRLSFVDDGGQLYDDEAVSTALSRCADLDYGCAIFELERR